jgi:hypothetical protein
MQARRSVRGREEAHLRWLDGGGVGSRKHRRSDCGRRLAPLGVMGMRGALGANSWGRQYESARSMIPRDGGEALGGSWLTVWEWIR